MARIFYSLVFYLLTPVVCLRLWWRGRRVPGYRRRWRERFGFMPPIPSERDVIWVHSVSVGETIAAVPMIRHLQSRYPGHLIAVTTTTPTGSDRVRAMLGDSVFHCYGPYDLPGAVIRALERLHPRCLIIMETELWPNLIYHCHRRRVPVVLANARLSARSARGYQRFGWLTRPMLRQLTLVAAQYPEDGERFAALGLDREKLEVTGNIKFDTGISPGQRCQAAGLRREWGGPRNRPVWLAASTHRGEEEIVLEAFEQVRRKHPDTLLVLVPRHPDRFDAVATLCGAQGFSVVRRSAGRAPEESVEILLGDTMGELPVFYGACDLAFVGGSLVPVGGHNLLEPAAWEKPVLSGPHLFNFSGIASLLRESAGLTVCGTASELSRQVTVLLEDRRTLEEQGRRAHEVVASNRGAMERLLALIARQMG